jgi:hypothetical protein
MTPGQLLSRSGTGSTTTPKVDESVDYHAFLRQISAPITQLPEFVEERPNERRQQAQSYGSAAGGVRFGRVAGGGVTDISVTFGGSHRPSVSASARPNRFAAALAAIKPLALAEIDATDEVAWMDAAQKLRRVAATGRSQSPRHAAIALVVSDALTFTPSRARATASRAGLLAALRSLREPFVSAEMEREVVEDLVAGGWKLTAPFDASAFAEFAQSLSN